ncbi:MAG: hypothetical protein Q9187_008661 [Circinaria calcarea]
MVMRLSNALDRLATYYTTSDIRQYLPPTFVAIMGALAIMNVQVTSSKRRVDIDPEGDVLLQLKDIELRVSSKILKLSSKVWKAMFSLSFREGSVPPLDNKLRHITLPEDDPEAMEALCNLLHHQPQNVSIKRIDVFLERLAITADKYDCAPTLRYWSRHRLSQRIGRKKPNQAQLLSITYLLNDAVGFRRLTRHMVYSLHQEDDEGMAYGISDYSWSLLPDGLFETIKAVEDGLKRQLLKKIEEIIAPLLKKRMAPAYPKLGILRDSGGGSNSHRRRHFSECDSVRIGVYMKELLRLGLWPLTTAFCKSDLVDIVTKVRSGQFEPPSLVGDGCLSCQLDLGAEASLAVEDVLKVFHGLCLDCVKYGEPQEGEVARCRNPHPGYEGGMRKDWDSDIH